MGIMKKRFLGEKPTANDLVKFGKVDELSLLLIRMGIQNADFSAYSEPMLVFSSIYTAATMLQLDQNKNSLTEIPASSRSGKAFFYTEFKA